MTEDFKHLSERIGRTLGAIWILAMCACGASPRIVASASGMCDTAWTAEYSSDAVRLNSQEDCFGRLTKHRRAPLAPGWWAAVDQLLSEVRFADLPGEIHQKPRPDGTITVMTDDTSLCIETSGLRRHRVCGLTVDIQYAADGRRFAKLWNYLVGAIPDLAKTEAISVDRTAASPPRGGGGASAP